MKPNRVKQLIAEGTVPIGHMVVEFWTRGMARIAEAIGFDFLIYDMEHAALSSSDLADQLAWTKSARLAALVRPPSLQYHDISRALDAGAQGFLIPRVESAEEVRQVVQAVKYPPEGGRGISFQIAHDDFLPGDGAEKMQAANAETLIIIQIEKASALEEIDEIVAIPGVDIVWPGQYDLSASLGITGQFEHQLLVDAMDRVVAAANRAGKVAGIQPTSVSQALSWIERGFRCISYSEDMLVYMDACQRDLRELRTSLET